MKVAMYIINQFEDQEFNFGRYLKQEDELQ
jgi:hypothetical protein